MVTDDQGIKLVQDRDPATGNLFTNKDEALTWATEYAKSMNAVLTMSEEEISKPSALETLQQQVVALQNSNTSLKTVNDLLKGCVMELANMIYS
jgi:hypothetical protein